MGVPLPAHGGHGHTTVAPSLWEGGCRRHHLLCNVPISPFGSNTTFVTCLKGLPTNGFSTRGRDHARPAQRQCPSPQFDESTRKNPAERINQWQSKPEAIKELQIWVNQGTYCADLDFHPVPGYGMDCWKPAQRSSPPGWSGSTQRQPEHQMGRVQENSGLPRGLKLQTPSPP